MSSAGEKPDYGVDAPNVLRNLFLFGLLCLLVAWLGPHRVHIRQVTFVLTPMFVITGILLFLEGCLYLFYVKFGKLRHRDLMLSLRTWRGDEQVLDIGCGRGLLLAGAASRLTGRGHATGIDIWSKEDMGGNDAGATRHNLELEGVNERCTLVSVPAQEISFPDASFDVIVSNLCLHNIYDRKLRLRALQQIARVLKPGGQAILSDYKLTSEYAKALISSGFDVKTRLGNILHTFPPLRIVIATKPNGTT